MLIAPITEASIGMGNNIIITAFVVIIVGGIGSMKGAFIAALLIGLIDTLGRSFLDDIFKLVDVDRGRRNLGPCRVGNADLHHHGGGAGVATAGPVPAEGALMGLGKAARALTLIATGLVGRSAAAFLLYRQCLLPRPCHAADHPCHRRRQPEPDPRLRRDDLVRPRRLSRDLAPMRWASRPTTGYMAGWKAGALPPHRPCPVPAGRRHHRAVRAGHRRDLPAHQGRLFHHDHHGLRADGLLRLRLDRGIRRR